MCLQFSADALSMMSANFLLLRIGLIEGLFQARFCDIRVFLRRIASFLVLCPLLVAVAKYETPKSGVSRVLNLIDDEEGS